MSPRTPEQFDHMRKDKKALITKAALELFSEQGYHNSSISKIANKAGVSKGLMYNYFESKEALIMEILSEGLDAMVSFFDPNHDGVLSEEEMESFIRNIFGLLKRDAPYWKIYYSVFLQPKVFELIEKKYKDLMPMFMNLLADYYKSHGAKNPMNEALLFGAMMDGIGFSYVMNPELYPLDDLIETILEKFCYIKK
jgi:AcrR family transcriptional regulator